MTIFGLKVLLPLSEFFLKSAEAFELLVIIVSLVGEPLVLVDLTEGV